VIPLILQDTIDRSLLESFTDHRRIDKKKPMSARAVDMLIKKLSRLESDGYCPNLLLERSIINGWQDVFANDSCKKVNEQSFMDKHTDKSWREGFVEKYDGKWADGL